MPSPMQDKPLRLMHLTSGSDPGGISRYLHDMTLAMGQRGHQVTIAGQCGPWHDLFTSAGINWVEVPLNGGPMALKRAARQLEGYLRQHPVDLLHSHYRKASLVGRWLSRPLDLPLLYTLHLPGFPVRGPWRWFSDFGDHSHAVSRQSGQWLTQVAGVRAQRITVIPHGVDSQHYPLATEEDRLRARRGLGLPADATVAGFVGRFEPQKNPQWFLDVAAMAAHKLKNVRFVMVGGGPLLAQLRLRIEADRLSPLVHILEYGDPLPLYQACDALLLPSQQEGFALVCAEAMSVGRAVLRTQTSGFEEQIIEGQTGQSVPVSHEQFVPSAVAFLSDRHALHRMGHAAGAHVRQNMQFDKQVDRTIDLYRALVRQHGKGVG